MKNSKEYNRKYYYKRRNAIIEYLGGKCKKCNSKENLEIDHINKKTKSFNITKRLTLNSSIVQDELKKCQLLCKECHLNKSVSEKEKWTHGTMYGWMKKKCICVFCIEHKINYKKIRNIKRRKGYKGK